MSDTPTTTAPAPATDPRDAEIARLNARVEQDKQNAKLFLGILKYICEGECETMRDRVLKHALAPVANGLGAMAR